MTLRLHRIAPIGKRIARGFGHRTDGTPVYEWEEDEYLPSPQGDRLRHIRLSLGLGLREACAALGISAAEYCGLELGRYTADWAQAEKLLRAADPKRMAFRCADNGAIQAVNEPAKEFVRKREEQLTDALKLLLSAEPKREKP